MSTYWDDPEGDEPNYAADRDNAILWARNLLTRTDWLVLDTETSGLGYAEIVQIGLLAPDGTALMDTLVKPDWTGFTRPGIEAKALAAHGIREADCAEAPALTDLLPEISRHLIGKTVVVYNVSFDHPLLCGCLHRRGLIQDVKRFAGISVIPDDGAFPWLAHRQWQCAMERYAQFVGDWNYHFGNYRWQRLPSGDHSALGDCKATLKVIQEMAAAKTSQEKQ